MHTVVVIEINYFHFSRRCRRDFRSTVGVNISPPHLHRRPYGVSYVLWYFYACVCCYWLLCYSPCTYVSRRLNMNCTCARQRSFTTEYNIDNLQQFHFWILRVYLLQSLVITMQVTCSKISWYVASACQILLQLVEIFCKFTRIFDDIEYILVDACTLERVFPSTESVE